MKRLLPAIIFIATFFLLSGLVHAQESQTVTTGDFTKPIEFPGGNCVYRWTNSNPFIGLSAAGGVGNIASFKAVNTLPMPAVATFTAEPIASDFAYVPVYTANSVSVVSTATHSVVASIPVGDGPLGVAVNPQGTFVYISNAIGNTVSVISTATNKVVAAVFVGAGPRGIAVSKDGSRVYVANSDSDNVSVIDAASNEIIATIPTGQTPVGMVISPDGSKLYVANTNGGSISVIRLADNSTTAIIPVDKFTNYLDITPDGKTLYATCGANTTVTVISAVTNSVINAIEVGTNPRAIAISADGSKAYVNVTSGATAIIDIASGAVSTRSTPTRPEGIAIAPDGSIYVIDTGGGNLIYYNPDFSYGGQLSIGAGAVFGNFIKKSQPCTASPVTFTITVNPTSTTTLTAGPVSGNITSCIGTASASPFLQQFKVSGTGLTGNITATAPTGFEVSLSPVGGFANSVSIARGGGAVNDVRVYIRASATAATGYISGSVTLTTPGIAAQNVAVNGWVDKLPAINNPGDKSAANGETLPAINITGTANIYRWTNDNTAIGLPASGEGDITSFKAINNGSTQVVANIKVTPIMAQLAYVTNFNDNTVSVVDIARATVLKTIPVGKSPNGVAISRDGSTVFVSNYDSDDISVISTFSNTVTKTIAVGKNPSALAISRDGSKLYVANNGTNQIAAISTSTFQTLNILTVGQNPNGFAVSHDGTRLYVLNYSSGNISVVDVASNTVVGTINVGMGFPNLDLCISPDDSRLYATQTSATQVYVFNTATNALETKIPAPVEPRYLAISPDGNTLYGSTGMVLDLPSRTFKTNTPLHSQLPGLALSADGLLLLETNDFENNLTVVNTATNAVVSNITVGKFPLVMGNFIKENPGCNGVPIDFKITVNPTLTALPVITATAAIGQISACVGSVSASPKIQQFKVSGSDLIANISATAPAGFEISLAAGSGYANTVSMVQTGGKVNDVTVYVRAVATANAGNISGIVTLSSAAATTQNVSVKGLVSALPAVNNPGKRTEENGVATQPVIFTGLGNKFTWTNDNPAIGLAASGDGEVPAFTPVNTGKTPITAHVTVTPASIAYAYVVVPIDHKILVINRESNTVVTDIPVGRVPVGIAVSPDGGKLYVANFTPNSVSDGDLTVINTATNKVLKTITIGRGPYGVAVTPNGRFVYVANQLSNSVSVIDAGDYSVIANVPVGVSPVGLSASADGQKVYVANTSDRTVSVISTSTNRVTATFSVGAGPLTAIASNDGTRIYVPNSSSNSVSVIDASNYSLIATIPLNGPPNGIAITPDGSRVYVSSPNANLVSVINTATNSVSSQILPGQIPNGVDVSADGSELFIESANSHTVGIYDVETDALKTTITTGTQPTSTLGKFLWDGSSCSGAPVTFEITVNPTAPVITAGPATGTISACVGSASAYPNVQQFTVSGINLTAGVAATAPAGFEISLNKASGYVLNLLIPQTGGKVDKAIVYVRASATGTSGAISGNAILSTADGEKVSVRLSGYVNALPTVTKPGDQSLKSGEATSAVNFAGTGNGYTWTNDNGSIGLGVIGTGDIPSFTAINPGSTPAIATITVTPQRKSYIYVANSTDNTVSVINPEGGATIKTIPVGTLPYGVMVSPNGTRVYVSNISDKSVSVINTASNTVIAIVSVGDRPFGISVSPDGSRVYVANEASNTVSVIDGVSNTVMATIPTGQFPVATLVSPDGSRLYVANQKSSSISVFNTSNNTLVAEIPTQGQTPAQMAFSPGGGMLYVVGIGNQDTFQAFDTATFGLIKSLSFSKDAHALAVTPDGSKIYVTDNTEHVVWILDGAQLAYSARIFVNANPNGVSVSSDGNFVFVVNGRTGVSGGSVSVIGTAIDQVLYTLPVGNGPISIGNFVGPTTSCPGDAVTFTITVAPPPPPTLTVSGTLSPLTTVYGTPSASQSFTVSGTNIVNPIALTAPAGFELSTDNLSFGNTATLTGNGTVSKPVYIRLAATTPVGNYSGNIVVATPNIANATVPMPNSNVTPALVTITADNKNKLLGADNPTLTVSYSGFVNNETAAVITRLPDLSTTATVASAAGEYPITASNATARNYTFVYVAGVLTVQPSLALVTIPNTFTPNGDGVNDTWNLTFLQGYNKATVNVFDRWGGKIYSSVGYTKAWDGRHKGAVLPAGTYYYIINPKDGQKPLAGWVAIVR